LASPAAQDKRSALLFQVACHGDKKWGKAQKVKEKWIRF